MFMAKYQPFEVFHASEEDKKIFEEGRRAFYFCQA
jgi:hypothetical protein